jgi:hypothetical protein
MHGVCDCHETSRHAGFLHESNTSLSVGTTRQHFEEASLTRGVDPWEGSNHELGGDLEKGRTIWCCSHYHAGDLYRPKLHDENC